MLESSIKKSDPVETVTRRHNELLRTFDEFKKYNNELYELTADGKSLKAVALKSGDILRLSELVDPYSRDLKSQASQLRPIQIEKLPLPKFNGEIRSYPRFKKDFEDLVLPQIPPAQASFTLRQCLTPEIESFLGSCEVMLMSRLNV